MTTTADAQTKPVFKATDEFLETHGRNLFLTSQNMRLAVESRWLKSNDLYDSKFSATERKMSAVLGIPRLFIPKTYAQVDRIHSEVMETFFFDTEEVVQIVGANKNVPQQAVEGLKAVLNHRLNEHPIRFYQETHDAVQNILVRKVGIFKVWPELEYEDAIDTDLDATEKKLKSYRPQIECLKYEDVFFDVRATWKDYYKYAIIHRTNRTVDYCRRRGYKGTDLLSTSTGASGADPIKQQRDLSNQSPFGINTELPKAQQDVWVFEFWDFMPGEDGFLESGSYIMLGSSPNDPSVLARGWKCNTLPYDFDEDYVRPPIVVGTGFPEAHRMYGKDWPEITEGLQNETNSQRNQEREAVARALRAPLLVDKNAGIDMVALMTRKIGGVVVGEDISDNGVRELGQSNPLALTQGSQQRTDLDYSEISSITPQTLGIQRAGANSATEFAGLDRNSNKKMAKVVRNVAFTLLIPAIRMLARLEQRYGSDEYIAFVTGQALGWKLVKQRNENGDLEYVGTRPLFLIQGEFDFSVNIGVNKQAQMQQLQTITQIGNQSNMAIGQLVQTQVVPPDQVQFFNPQWAFEQMAKLNGFKNTKEMKVQAKAPPPQQGQAGPGVASQPSISGAPGSAEDVLAR